MPQLHKPDRIRGMTGLNLETRPNRWKLVHPGSWQPQYFISVLPTWTCTDIMAEGSSRRTFFFPTKLPLFPLTVKQGLRRMIAVLGRMVGTDGPQRGRPVMAFEDSSVL
ncbi:Hypothetical predicted protein [Marmota monax]|uniref:Uncharacterized protein n=1 Tax=Marmota monax TaxID=9995 RepID=A0A5E4CAT1_MARMO|nr:Hypothetical predicted protein [Marmota monax]